ncbi:MAG: hypothetical protein NTX50_04305 [Candidatus Sumerlaeota bacterium]|nr:hypothetical protein [Candidatus Sumerlaeota bacterium]
MILSHLFWLLVVIAVMGWYCTITVYVSFKGALDIKHMLQRLTDLKNNAPK